MSSSPTERTVEVTLPELAGDVLEAIVVGWEKHPGDWVDNDEPICIVSADGLRSAVASSASGYLVRLLAGVGARIGPGTSLAEIATVDALPAPETGADAEPERDREAELESGTSGEPEHELEVEDDADPATYAEPEYEADGIEPEAEEPIELEDFFAPLGDRAARKPPELAPSLMSSFHSPAVKRLAAEHAIDLTDVPGTGAGGRVRKEDVLAYVEEQARVADASIAEDAQEAGST